MSLRVAPTCVGNGPHEIRAWAPNCFIKWFPKKATHIQAPQIIKARAKGPCCGEPNGSNPYERRPASQGARVYPLNCSATHAYTDDSAKLVRICCCWFANVAARLLRRGVCEGRMRRGVQEGGRTAPIEQTTKGTELHHAAHALRALVGRDGAWPVVLGHRADQRRAGMRDACRGGQEAPTASKPTSQLARQPARQDLQPACLSVRQRRWQPRQFASRLECQLLSQPPCLPSFVLATQRAFNAQVKKFNLIICTECAYPFAVGASECACAGCNNVAACRRTTTKPRVRGGALRMVTQNIIYITQTLRAGARPITNSGYNMNWWCSTNSQRHCTRVYPVPCPQVPHSDSCWRKGAAKHGKIAAVREEALKAAWSERGFDSHITAADVRALYKAIATVIQTDLAMMCEL
jgi:hypothetical protein